MVLDGAHYRDKPIDKIKKPITKPIKIFCGDIL